MGGRGSFATGNNVAYTYKTVGKIGGVKVLQPIDKNRRLKLPEEAHSSKAYILLDHDGIFHQYREFDEHHRVIFEIDYHKEPKLGEGKVLHMHSYSSPGITNRSEAKPITKEILEKYKKYFKGVKL